MGRGARVAFAIVAATVCLAVVAVCVPSASWALTLRAPRRAAAIHPALSVRAKQAWRTASAVASDLLASVLPSHKPSGPTTDDGSAPSNRRFDYASETCGAKIISASAGVQSASSILESNKDRYMQAPCDRDVSIIVELCQAIRIEAIAVANYELFSSTFRRLSIFGSFNGPANMEWLLLGEYTAADVLDLQTFVAARPMWARYLRLVVYDHWRSERMCTLSSLSVFGSSLVEDIINLEWSEGPDPADAQPQPVLPHSALRPTPDKRDGFTPSPPSIHPIVGPIPLPEPDTFDVSLEPPFFASWATGGLFQPASDDVGLLSNRSGAWCVPSDAFICEEPNVSLQQIRATPHGPPSMPSLPQSVQPEKSPQAVFSGLAARMRRIEINQSMAKRHADDLTHWWVEAYESLQSAVLTLRHDADSVRDEIQRLEASASSVRSENTLTRAQFEREMLMARDIVAALEVKMWRLTLLCIGAVLLVVVLACALCVMLTLDWNRSGPLTSGFLSPRLPALSPPPTTLSPVTVPSPRPELRRIMKSRQRI